MTASLNAADEALPACPAGPLCSVVAQLPETLPIAAAEAGAVFAWYALPDIIRSRPLRAVAKVGLMGGILAMEAWRNRETLNYVRDVLAGGPDEDAPCGQCAEPATDVLTIDEAPSPRMILAGLAVPLGAATLAAVAGERWLFRRGERRRSSGLSKAHTRQALCLSALTAAMVVVDDLFLSDHAEDEDSSSCCQ